MPSSASPSRLLASGESERDLYRDRVPPREGASRPVGNEGFVSDFEGSESRAESCLRVRACGSVPESQRVVLGSSAGRKAGTRLISRCHETHATGRSVWGLECALLWPSECQTTCLQVSCAREQVRRRGASSEVPLRPPPLAEGAPDLLAVRALLFPRPLIPRSPSLRAAFSGGTGGGLNAARAAGGGRRRKGGASGAVEVKEGQSATRIRPNCTTHRHTLTTPAATLLPPPLWHRLPPTALAPTPPSPAHRSGTPAPS